MNDLWRDIEEAVNYSQTQSLLLQLTKYLYPFLYYYFSEEYRRWKWKKVKAVMRTFLLEEEGEEEEAVVIVKFSCSSCYTQAFFDIVDYSKSELQWDIHTYMPLCLLLQGKGSFMNPFLVNDTDPLFSLLVTYVKSKAEEIVVVYDGGGSYIARNSLASRKSIVTSDDRPGTTEGKEEQEETSPIS